MTREQAFLVAFARVARQGIWISNAERTRATLLAFSYHDQVSHRRRVVCRPSRPTTNPNGTTP